MSPCPYPATITITPRAPPKYFGVVAIEKGAFSSPSTKGDNFTFYLLLIFLLYIQNNENSCNIYLRMSVCAFT